MNAGRNSILVSVKQPDGEELVLQARIQVLGADGEVFQESFGAYESPQKNKQSDTGLTVSHGGKIAGWSSSGAGAVQAVDRSMRTSETALTPADWAIMIFKDNAITSSEISANSSGKNYEVSFEASPAVYGDPAQATKAGDALLIEVLRKDSSVLKSFEHTLGAWSGKSALARKNHHEGFDRGGILD